MFHKKPYLKNIDNISGMKVWLVDGKYIRDNIDKEFTNFGQHYRFKFVPIDEFWIDKENEPGEEKYFIDHLLIENRMMAQGKNFEQAVDQADRVERRERNKSKQALKVSAHNKKEIINKIHKKLLSDYGNKLKIWLVSGELVRDLFYNDFTEGGHDKVYGFIPLGEIWIDDDVVPEEKKYIILHELHERNLMDINSASNIKNKILVVDDNYSKIYTAAHNSATKLEYFCRRHPEELDKKIQEEYAFFKKKL